MDPAAELHDQPGHGQGLGECYRLILSLKKKHAQAKVEADQSTVQDEIKPEVNNEHE